MSERRFRGWGGRGMMDGWTRARETMVRWIGFVLTTEDPIGVRLEMEVRMMVKGRVRVGVE